MKKKLLIVFIVCIMLVVLGLFAQCLVRRWSELNIVYDQPRVLQRARMLPVEIDFTGINASQAITCNIGYAAFAIPNCTSVTFRSHKQRPAVSAEANAMRFIFLAPVDPRKDLDEFKAMLATLPGEHPMRKALGGRADITMLDTYVQQEQMTPKPFFYALCKPRNEFLFDTGLLFDKGTTTVGRQGVFTFHTDDIRGMIRLTSISNTTSFAHVMIEHLSKEIGLGIDVRSSNCSSNEIMSRLLYMIKTFRFTVDKCESKERILQLIAEAGIHEMQIDQDKQEKTPEGVD